MELGARTIAGLSERVLNTTPASKQANNPSAMALWNALGPAATVAQLVGADAGGLISATLHAVRTARRNRKECLSLARRVMMVGDLLQLVQQGSSETLRRPEVRRALDGLGAALRRAFELVESCQDRGAAYGFVMAGRQAEQFRDVQGEIDSYLLVFPMVSHIEVTIRLDRIYNMLVPPDQSQQVLEGMDSATSHLESDARNEHTALRGLQSSGSNQTVPHSFEVLEHAGIDYQVALEETLTRDLRRSKWLCWWPQNDISEGPAPEAAPSTYYKLLKAATNEFSSEYKIGEGGTSIVYKAHTDGVEIAIKKFTANTKQFRDNYENEVTVLSKLQHTNIIKLLGHCTGTGEKVLVFEYMPNRSLDKFIFDERSGVPLDWLSRFRIIQGIAEGLQYLQTSYDGLCIVHRDLKPGNILLDSDMNAKICDFGLARMLTVGSPVLFEENKMLSTEFTEVTRVVGTLGYLAPEYAMHGIISSKVDVYAYGVILLEIISGKKSYLEDTVLCTLTDHAWRLWGTMSSADLIEPSLRNESQTADILKCIQIAMLCIQTDPADRPSMSDVLLMLGNQKTILSPIMPDFCESNGYESEVSPSNGYESEATWSSSELTWPR